MSIKTEIEHLNIDEPEAINLQEPHEEKGKPTNLDPIVTDLLFEPRKSEFVKSETFVPMTFALDQTLTYIENEGLVDFTPTILPRPLIHDDIVSRPMIHLLANFK